jgi:hypothetical protein
MEKVTSLTGKPLEHCEYPQVAKYVAGQQYGQHFDGFCNLAGPTARNELSLGGNRLATVLLYLSDVGEGGETYFHYMDLKIRPTKGTALVFFPSTANGELNVQTVHAALPTIDTKYVSSGVGTREHFYWKPTQTSQTSISRRGCRLEFLSTKQKTPQNSPGNRYGSKRASTEGRTKHENTNGEYCVNPNIQLCLQFRLHAIS